MYVGLPDILTYLALRYLVTLFSPTCLTLSELILAAIYLVAASVPIVRLAAFRSTTMTLFASEGADAVAVLVLIMTVNP